MARAGPLANGSKTRIPLDDPDFWRKFQALQQKLQQQEEAKRRAVADEERKKNAAEDEARKAKRRAEVETSLFSRAITLTNFQGDVANTS